MGVIKITFPNKPCRYCSGTEYTRQLQDEYVVTVSGTFERIVMHFWCVKCSSGSRMVGFARILSENPTPDTIELAETIAGCSLEGWSSTDFRRYLDLAKVAASVAAPAVAGGIQERQGEPSTGPHSGSYTSTLGVHQ